MTNEYAKNNQEMFNKEKTLVDVEDIARAYVRFLQCVDCGKYNLTQANLSFFDFDPTKFKCYQCQVKI